MRLVIVSNRLPVVLEATPGEVRARRGAGGLVTALGPVLRRCGGVWIGWPGGEGITPDKLRALLDEHGRHDGFELIPVALSSEQIDGFYKGFSNEIIWPLFHDLQSRCNFVPEYWTTYRTVRDRFAEVAAGRVEPGDFVWVQDYHLMGLGRRLRDLGLTNKLGYFLHIPFPPPDIFCKLPWRTDVLEAFLRYDVVGFQTPRDLENFLDCVRTLLPDARRRRARELSRVTLEGRTCAIGSFPIGIDFDEFGRAAAVPTITRRVQQLRADLQAAQILLGVDRLDYTKGIPYRLRAFRLALRRYPDLHRQVTLLQVVVPSRENVPEYKDLKAEIEGLVSQINGEFTQPGWVPIHYVFRSLEHDELLAYYRLADVALVTPLKDGMNLVAKEYCACQVEGDGVLILSEFAGSAVQMKRDAVLVNPYDLDRVAEAIRRAVSLNRKQRRPAMRRLRRIVQQQDIYWWLQRFLTACGLTVDALSLKPQAKSEAEAVPA
jgi:trehalose 6-phosphate synthase